jgi:aldehyde:ferredoxin oxidoreductase
MNGYTGRILFVNLSDNSVRILPTEKYIEQFVGGRGIAVKLLYELTPKNVDPLSPENALIFMTGPLTGTIVPSSGRIDVVSKSPQTNLLGGSNAGGFFGPELKYAGYDGIVVTGRASSTVYIDIYNDSIEIKSAENLSGKGVFDTVKALRKKDGDTQVACIGPAGERLVNLSGIAFSMRNYAARCGFGAVMGSKNLKAIAVRGTRGLDVAVPDQLKQVADEMRERIKATPSYKEFPEWYHKLFRVLEADAKTFFGNYDDVLWDGRFEAYENAEKFVKGAELKLQSCFGCPLRCWAYISVRNVGKASVVACQGTLTSIVNFAKIKDFNKVWEAYILCQDMGLDISGTSATIAFAMDLYSKGILSKNQVNNLELTFGDGNAFVSLVKKIAGKEGIGGLLAEGVKKASEKLGEAAKKLAVYAKGGQELWLMEIRPFKGVALSCAVTDSGSHNRATYGLCEFYYRSMKTQAETVARNIVGTEEAAQPTKYEYKPKLVAAYEDIHILADSLGVCSIPFMPVGLELWAKAYTASTGRETLPKTLMTAAERIRTLERLFNIREGLTRRDDTIAERMFNEPLKEGPWKGEVLDKIMFEKMIDEYYSLRGWDSDGKPKPETLKRLGLESICA